jgi:hypothetical protein
VVAESKVESSVGTSRRMTKYVVWKAGSGNRAPLGTVRTGVSPSVAGPSKGCGRIPSYVPLQGSQLDFAPRKSGPGRKGTRGGGSRREGILLKTYVTAFKNGPNLSEMCTQKDGISLPSITFRKLT